MVQQTGVPYFPQTLPPNSVVGRFSPTAGPTEAIPFSTLASAISLNATSTTLLTIGAGSQTLTIQTQAPVAIGQFIIIANTATPANFMFGQVTNYVPLTGVLTVNVTAVGGAGSFSAWTITASGQQGPAGAGVSIGAAGGTVNAVTVSISGAATADKQVIGVVHAGAATTTTPTLKLNSDTAHTITTRGGAAIKVGDIGPAGFVGLYEYNAAGTRWELMNPIAGAPKVLSFAYDLATASGNVSFTGFGFKGRFADIIANVSGTAKMCMGKDDGVTAGCLYDNENVTTLTWGVDTNSIAVFQSAGDFVKGKVGSFDADGITFAMVKTGAPIGSLTLKITITP